MLELSASSRRLITVGIYNQIAKSDRAQRFLDISLQGRKLLHLIWGNLELCDRLLTRANQVTDTKDPEPARADVFLSVFYHRKGIAGNDRAVRYP